MGALNRKIPIVFILEQKSQLLSGFQKQNRGIINQQVVVAEVAECHLDVWFPRKLQHWLYSPAVRL